MQVINTSDLVVFLKGGRGRGAAKIRTILQALVSLQIFKIYHRLKLHDFRFFWESLS